MKVLLITQHFPPEIGAASNRMNNIAYYLGKEGVDLTVLTSEPTYPNRRLYENSTWEKEDNGLDNIDILRVKNPFKDYSTNKVKRIGLYLNFMLRGILDVIKNKKRFDAIIVTSPPIFAAVIGVVLKKKYKSKLILDIRDLWPDSIKDLKIFKNDMILKPAYFFEKIMYKRADKIIINSEGFINPLKSKGIEDNKLVYIPNGIRSRDLIINKNDLEKKRDVIEVIYAGTIGYAQGIDSLIEVAKSLKDHKNITFKIIGTGVELEKIEDLASQYQLNNVKFLGVLSKNEVFTQLSKSHIGFIHLKDLEVFKTVIPSKIFEYMLAELPIVGGVRGYIANMISEKSVGLISSPYDVKVMSESILKLAQDEDMRKEMVNNQRKLLKDEFIWDENIKKLIDLL
ncbi:glycosyltransferase family 4 protein [Clostridium sp. D2Q-11]|uniref:Glycosyltransferase family 4 protein n=1 Tax=Anaeromonas frigoriresistens TaxID=2683708 RepID=A0A942Z9S4_9FIRM|nr:glycosyltransferase family 4 protein [Anaeromonas frigoriresistens]MBS4539135.1 glycosyltransferase family 4 protein [Anaeromonas frigoriresistens]